MPCRARRVFSGACEKGYPRYPQGPIQDLIWCGERRFGQGGVNHWAAKYCVLPARVFRSRAAILCFNADDDAIRPGPETDS